MSGFRSSGHPGVPIDRNPGALRRIPPDDRPEGWRLKVTAAVWHVGWEAARRLPEPLVFAVADLAGRLAHRLARSTRQRVRRNFARVVGQEELTSTTRAAFRSYARYWVEAFRAADITPTDVDRRTTAEGFEHLDKALGEGAGAIVLLAHHGSWDIAARWGETHGYHLAVVVEVLRPRSVFAKFVALREAIGLEVVPLGGGTALVGRLAEVLAANHIVGLLTDRDLTGTAPVVRFFGEDARIPMGPVILSRRTGAPIVPVTMLQQPGRRWRAVALPRVEVGDVTLAEGAQRVAQALEALIRLAPEQWHAFSPVWIADLPAGARRRPARPTSTA
jgi:lauroyl/myristoyl acyltransferase